MGLTYLITGATRGIGLEFARQLSEDPENKVIASARNLNRAGKLEELADLKKNLFIVELEVGNPESTDKLAKQLFKIDSGIDVFIHNAGIALPESAGLTINIGREVWLEQYKVNVLGPIEVFKAVYPLLIKRKTRKVAFLSSVAGSLSEFVPLPFGAYGQSKAALNYTIKHIAVELQSESFTVLSTHPGLVKTDMGNDAVASFDKVLSEEAVNRLKSRAITAEQSVSGLLKVISKAKVEDSGKFFYHDESEHGF